MKLYQDILERSTKYWKETNRKSYIALYKGERLNTKQIAYLTEASAVLAVRRLLEAGSFTWYKDDIEDNTMSISTYVKQLLTEGTLTIVALEDVTYINSVTDDLRFESLDSPKSNVEPMVLCENYNEYFNAQINN